MAGANTTTQVGGYGGAGGAGGDLLSTNNLSDVASAATSRTNLGFSALTDYVTLTGTQTLTSKTLTTPTIADIRGTNAKSVLKLSDGASNVNYWDVFASNTGAGITIRAGGTDTNITASFYGKGAGETNLGIATAAATNIYGLTVNSYTTNGTLNLTTAGVLGLGTTTASTNSVVNVESRSLTTSGTAATGLGLSKTSYIEIAGGSASLAATESVYLTDGTSGAANVLWTLDAGSSNLNAFEILGSSGIKMGGSTTGYVTIKPSATAGDWTLTLPANDGTSGQFLQTDGNGVGSWATASGGGSSTFLTLTAPFTLAETGSSPSTSAFLSLSTNNLIAIAGYTNVVRYASSVFTTTAHGGAASAMTAIAANGQVVLVSGTGTTWRRSTNDGATWSTVTHGLTAATYTLPGIGPDNGASTTWLMCHSNSASLGGRSTDNGATWSNVAIASAQAMKGIACDTVASPNTSWIAISTTTATRKSTDDGATWAAGSTLASACLEIIYAASKFWAIGNSSGIHYAATPAAAWTLVKIPGAVGTIKAFGYANSKFCFVDAVNNFFTSSDPSSATNSWTREGIIAISTSASLGKIIYYESAYWLLNQDGGTFIQFIKLA